MIFFSSSDSEESELELELEPELELELEVEAFFLTAEDGSADFFGVASESSLESEDELEVDLEERVRLGSRPFETPDPFLSDTFLVLLSTAALDEI